MNDCVLATDDGANDRVYMGCRFPAARAYATELARRAESVGEAMARRGALGRISLDFAAACDEAGQWSIYALEMTSGRAGQTHPYAALRKHVPGHHDAERGVRTAADGSVRSYVATDNLVDPAWGRGSTD